MPISIYSIQTRGHNMGGSQRCNNKEEAEAIYTKLLDAVNSDKVICELELNGNKVAFRTKDLTGFGLNVHLEETPEEIKERRIAEIEQGMNYPNALGYAGKCENTAYIGGGLI